MREFCTSHLVKSEDLNHHGTLFAGRMAEWFVEAAFIAAAACSQSASHLVCRNIHSLAFKSPFDQGDILNMKTRVAFLGNTSILVYGKIVSEMTSRVPAEGFITFVAVDDQGRKRSHGLVLDETTDQEELLVRDQARQLIANIY